MSDDMPKMPEGWTDLVRASGLIEWVCPHGVGHPAPTELQPENRKSTTWSVHGCDGCCHVYSGKAVKTPAVNKAEKLEWTTTCADCGSDRITVSIENDCILYEEEEGQELIPTRVPVFRCNHCGFEFTDFLNGIINSNVLQIYLQMKGNEKQAQKIRDEITLD